LLTLRYDPHHGIEGKAYGSPTSKENTVVLSSPSVVLRRSSVNKTFGPTYAGDTLSFPGIWFAFDEDGAYPSSPPGPTAGRQAMSASPPSGAGSVDRNAEVKRVVICQRSGKDAFDTMGEVGELPSMDGELRTAVVEVIISYILS
jgi:hypothetical protein